MVFVSDASIYEAHSSSTDRSEGRGPPPRVQPTIGSTDNKRSVHRINPSLTGVIYTIQYVDQSGQINPVRKCGLSRGI